MSTFDSATLHLIQQLKKKKKWKKIQWKQVVEKYLKVHNMSSTNNTKEFRTRMSKWYHKTPTSTNKSDKPEVTGTKSTEPKPTTKQELRTWLEEYCAGVKHHGEPNTWDVTSVTDMSELFRGLTNFNEPIGQWVTSNVTNMAFMFYKATTFNQPLPFDTAQVTTMLSMFYEATAFNQPLPFDTAQVTTMRGMFCNTTAFNQPLTFDTAQVTNMSSMFHGATTFNQPLTFDTAQVTDMDCMFMGATTFNQPLTFNTAQVTEMRAMFYKATAFNQPLTFDTAQVTTMLSMFYEATAFNQPLTFDTSQVTDMRGMFHGATAMTYSKPGKRPKPTTKEELRTRLEEYCEGVKHHGEPNTWDVTSVTDMSELFRGLTTFNAPIGQWDTAQVTNMSSMFEEATAFNQPLTFNTSKVTTMRGMFHNATAFNQPLTFDTAQVTDMAFMFEGATTFNQPLTFDTAQVTDMSGMFQEATAFNQPLTFNTAQVTTMEDMFSGAESFNQPLTFDTAQVTNMEDMFYRATAMTYPRPRVDDSSSEEDEEEEAEHRQRQLDKMNHIIATGSGGIFATDDFRTLPRTCLVKPDPDDAEEVISKSHVRLLTQGDVISMEDYTLGPARCLPCKHVIGTPQLHEWLNQNDADIEQNMDPDAGGLLGLAPRFKNECPTCRKTIVRVEILSVAQAKKWDEYEGKALKEEAEFRERAEYKQYVYNVSFAKTAVNAAKKKLEEEERKGVALRETSNKIQRGYRDLRLFKRLNLLDGI